MGFHILLNFIAGTLIDSSERRSIESLIQTSSFLLLQPALVAWIPKHKETEEVLGTWVLQFTLA